MTEASKFAQQFVDACALHPEFQFGVEWEFFLLCDHAPVTGKQSESFFQAAYDLFAEQFPLRLTQDGVAFSTEAGWFELKYELRPHLFELTTPPVARIEQIEETFVRAVNLVDRAAGGIGFMRAEQPVLSDEAFERVELPADPRAEMLRQYRAPLLPEGLDAAVKRRWLNFSAGLASTQLHFSGLNPAKLEFQINALYALEPRLRRSIYSEFADPVQLFRDRWAGYMAVLGELPLVGYPDWSRWSLSCWSKSLTQMPCLGPVPGKGIASHVDNQIIRPRDIGTVEMRADPAHSNPLVVLKQVVQRVEQAMDALENPKPAISYQESRTAWMSWFEPGVSENALFEHEEPA